MEKINSIQNNVNRSILEESKKPKKRSLVITISSGKGGVGKTLTTVNFALAASRMGLKVLIFDGDLGLANVDVVLGLQARYNIRDVFNGHAKIEDIILDGPLGVKIIPSGSGIASLQQLTLLQKQLLASELYSLDGLFDIVLIDTGAGISDNVIHLNLIADQSIVVTTPEPHAMTDAYALIKVIKESRSTCLTSLLVNMTRTESEGQNVAKRICDVAEKFMNSHIKYLGSVPQDAQVSRSVLIRRAISEDSIHTLSGQAWNKIARSMLSRHIQLSSTEGPQDRSFWQDLIWTQHESQNPLAVGAM
ncbi:MAG: MinD/ParA family protein [Bdellovibrionota bacterium]